MKITVINGSPRKNGNSHTIVAAFCEKAEKNGVDIRAYEMNSLKVKGCHGCTACKGKTDRCIIKDDITGAYERLHETDVLVIASPVYFGDLSAQVKPFIDRLYQLFTPDFHEGFDPADLSYNGKKISRLEKEVSLVFITTQGAVNPSFFADIQRRYENFFPMLGFSEVHHIRGLGDPAQNPAHRMDEAIRQARELAAELIDQKLRENSREQEAEK